jgi:hypothetical protein
MRSRLYGAKRPEAYEEYIFLFIHPSHTITTRKRVFVIYTPKGIYYIKINNGGVIAMRIPPPLKG